MPKAVIVIYHNGSDLGSVITPLAHLKRITQQHEISGDDVAITHDFQNNRNIIDILSTLKLLDYNTKAILIQKLASTQQDVQDYQDALSQLKLFGIEFVAINAQSTANPNFTTNIITKLLSDDKSKTSEASDPKIAQNGISRDKNDLSKQKHGRIIHEGSLIGQYIQTPPLLFTRDGHNMWFGDMFRGRSAFLILGGPSFNNIDKGLLNKAGVLTMAVNNSVKSFRPDMWVSVDSPGNFIKSCWVDPKIMKFVPYSHTEKTIFDNEKWSETDLKVGDCPNVWFYKRNEHFIADQFLWEDTFNWGNHKDHGGGRSIMLVAIRLLFYLGVRRIYLLGCDFKMDDQVKYHFDQDRSKSSINGNNSTYKILQDRFAQLQPIFIRNNLRIFNCNQDSGLTAFPFIEYGKAIVEATKELPNDITSERTAGLYDRLADIKRQKNIDKKAKT